MTKRTTTFTRGSGVYACEICGRKTRDDGNRDSVNLKQCSQCYALGGIQNMFWDGGAETADARQVLSLLEELAAKPGTNLGGWEELRAVATAWIAAHPEGQ